MPGGTISVVIPCLNERRRVLQTIKKLLGNDRIKEIIIVDDGSNEETKEVLGRLPKEITVLRHEQNLGKSAAMKTGLLWSKGEVVIFVDADLKNFSQEHLFALCEPVEKNFCDMAIGVREKEVVYSRMIACSAAYGGERAFLRKKLMEKIDIFQNHGYTIEAALNNYFLKEERVEKVLLMGVSQISKTKKNGLVGLLQSFQMTFEVLSSIGWKEFLFQTSMVNKLNYYTPQETR